LKTTDLHKTEIERLMRKFDLIIRGLSLREAKNQVKGEHWNCSSMQKKKKKKNATENLATGGVKGHLNEKGN